MNYAEEMELLQENKTLWIALRGAHDEARVWMWRAAIGAAGCIIMGLLFMVKL